MTLLHQLHEQYLHDLSSRTVAATRELYRFCVVALWPYLGNKRPAEVGVGEINLSLLRLPQHQLKGSRVAFIRNHIMRFWRWLEDNGHVEHTPLISR